jgi:hypothetical protein
MSNSGEIHFPKTLKRLFYPGAFSDFETLNYLIDNSSVKEFYFCDYLNNEDSITNIKTGLYEKLTGCEIYSRELQPLYFEKLNYDQFWHWNPDARSWGRIENSYITEYLILKGRKSVKLFYFGTEAIGTYVTLLQCGRKPDIVVLQNHGLGCLWTPFGGDDLLFQTARHNDKLPKCLMVGEGTNPWPGYVLSSGYFGQFGLHQNQRAVFIQQENVSGFND